MATRLAGYYAQAANEFGVVGRMKLAMLTKIPSERAATEPDSPAHIQAFEQALKQLRAGAR
ncbi:MAG TPA: hypothetical protein VN814_21355 [Caulobacteraceae bacterium]|nr:hypothetical protein [Caulobacteraceae bacterium]